MTSNPASLSELTERFVGGTALLLVLMVSFGCDELIISVDGDARSATNRVSRRKWVTFEKPPIVALYGSCMNFYTHTQTQQVAQMTQRNHTAGWVSFGWMVGDSVGQTILCTTVGARKLKAFIFYTINPLLYERKTVTLRF